MFHIMMIAMRNKENMCTLFKMDDRADTAITHMIFFIAAIIIALGVVAVLTVNVQSITSSTSVSSKVMAEQIRTDITVISDPEMIPYNSNTKHYTFYAKNTGKTELAPDYINVLLDGIFVSPNDMTLELTDQDVIWRPGDLLVINVSVTEPLDAGDHRIHVAVENGKSDTMSFKT